MRRLLCLALLAVPVVAAAQLRSSPTLGIAEGRCRENETGPAFRVTATGLRDRQGHLRLEVYPPGNDDFLADDNVLLNAGKTFRRVDIPVPASGPATLCVRLPSAGTYTVSLLHDRDANRRFGFSVDGVGFSNNPRLGLARPSASSVRVTAGGGVTPLSIVMNYRRGLLSVGPIEH